MRRRDDVVETLRQRLVSGIHLGTLEPGARLPSARTLARELRADPRVILAAYARLEREGLVRQQPRARGYFVNEESTAAGKLSHSTEWMVTIMERALAQGVHAPRFAEHVRRSLETVRLTTACVECNSDQLDWLCGELADDYGLHSSAVEVQQLGSAETLHPAFRSADLIVSTAAHSADARRVAKALDKPFVIASLRHDVTEEVLRTLRTGPVYFVCADVRYATKLKKIYASVPGARNVRTVVLGWDDPASIPDGAPTWMLRTAREKLGGVPPHVRALPTLRLFSAETTRALLSFVLRANAIAADALAARR